MGKASSNWNKSFEGIKLLMGENGDWGWKLEKELGLCPNKRLELGQPNIWFGKSEIVSVYLVFVLRQNFCLIIPTSIDAIVLFWRTQQRMHSLLNFFSLSKLLLLSSLNTALVWISKCNSLLASLLFEEKMLSQLGVAPWWYKWMGWLFRRGSLMCYLKNYINIWF